MQILQVLGENARGLRAEPMTHTWQKNTFTTLNMYVNANGEVKQDSLRNVVLLDTRSVEAGSRTPLEVTDTLGLKKALYAANTDQVLDAIKQTVNKNNLNFDGLGNVYESYILGDLKSWEFK